MPSNFDRKIDKTKTIMVHRKSFYYSLFVLVQIRFMQRKQFNETNVTLHSFQIVSGFEYFS